MEFTYNKYTQKYKLGETEYSENEFISYIKAGMLANALTEKGSFEVKGSNLSTTHTPSQTIYYGVPGSGKSHKIDELTKNLPEEQTLRVVFHPEYTNADFVGQILPSLNDGGVDYRFKAGPFSRILKKSIQNPNTPYYLIIEEINRGNAAAIFGDLFQLLDRNAEGYSCYEIENLDLNAFIRSKSSTHTDSTVESSVDIGGNIWTEVTGIRLPPNLSILATMNTSDQNVFTLDNAFQRRWDMELVPNTCDDKKQMNAKIKVLEQAITWENFQSEINKIIAEKGNESGFSSMEDKRLGCWFIKNQDGVIDTDKFANKVLKYLWDDAFKFNRSEIFIDEVKNFEKLKNLFIGDKGFEIFKDINFDFEPQNLEENQES
ncbi:MAG: AAA family ATPase [Treponema sp.]|nr:AAA family ATPase [Treponema sp.]